MKDKNGKQIQRYNIVRIFGEAKGFPVDQNGNRIGQKYCNKIFDGQELEVYKTLGGEQCTVVDDGEMYQFWRTDSEKLEIIS